MKPTLPFPIPATPEIDPHQVSGAAETYLDLAYAAADPAQRLDLYLPAVGHPPFALVIYLHEGAFAFGSKRDQRMEAVLPLLESGFAIASVEYRKSDRVSWPAQLYDAKTAVRFLRSHAETFGLDAQRFAVWGVSAGAYLASMLGVTADLPGFEDPLMGYAGVSSAVQAVVDWYGCSRFDRMDAQIEKNGLGRPTHNNENSPESIMMGNALPEISELCRLASPITYVHRDMPPFLIQHGEKDPVTPVQQSMELAERIQDVAGEGLATLILYNGGHDADVFYQTPIAREEARRFLTEKLQPSPDAQKALEIRKEGISREKDHE